jgi:hypothetical protein
MFLNDSKCFFIDGRGFTIRYNNVVDVSLSFEIVGNDRVCMTPYHPLTFITGGIMHTAPEGDKITLPVDRDVFLVSTSNPDRIHKLRVAKRRPPRGIQNLRWDGPAAARAPAPPPPPKPEPKRRKLREFHMC